MANLLKLELESIKNDIDRLMKNETITHKVHTDLECISENIQAAIRMMHVLYSEDFLMATATSKNTAVVSVETDGCLELRFNERVLQKGNISIDKKPSLLSRLLDAVALSCNSGEIEYLKINLHKDVLDYSKTQLTPFLERLAAFSATSGTIVIIPPDVIVSIKLKEGKAKKKIEKEELEEKSEPTVTFGEDEEAIIKAEERLKNSGSKIETKD